MALPAERLPLSSAPKDLPRWMRDPRYSEVFYKRGPYNFAVYGTLESLARDLNGVAVGHAMAYEDLVSGNAKGLETTTFVRIDAVLKHPPKLMPAERFLSPRFARTYAYLEKLFDWTHVLHAQTIDVLASPKLTQNEKDREIEALWRYYKTQVPYTITGLPLNMAYLDSQAYSWKFRRTYPKVNALFWGYHWLQTSIYDLLWRSRTTAEQRAQYAIVGEQYRKTELYRTDRDFMPMMAETSPEFARRFPEMSNAFDNLHMLHDMVNDILATESFTAAQRAEQIQRAIWLVSDDAHRGERPGDRGEPMHDHRFPDAQPGMGMMRMASPGLMFMSGMGWMNMSECAHCSMPIDFEDRTSGATVSVDGWTMNVRCVLCARDMAAQSEGRAIVRANTEDPARPLILISDERGEWTSNLPDVVFLEVPGPHPSCSAWSKAFTGRAAFDAYVKASDEDLGEAKPLSLAEWGARNGGEPDSYERRKGPVENPYKPGLAGGLR
ncbi:hypothetical protein EON79_12820 [bacterium]|nr:MAG: hypothetical protein EON79_12820 [bacterium]